MDIKTGKGAFLTSIEESIALSNSIIDIAHGANCNTVAIITDMNQPLANCVGNALEIIDVIKFLQVDCNNSRLYEVILVLASAMLQVTGISFSIEGANLKVINSLKSGKALKFFQKWLQN